MKLEVEQYITKNYYQLLAICKKYTKNDDWSFELLHEVILQLYDKKDFNCNLDDKSIRYYIVRMIMVNWVYPSSPFYRKHKLEMNMVEISEALHLTNTESEMDHHTFLDILEEEFQEEFWFNRLIFEKYLLLGSLKKVAVDTTISLPSIGRYVKETKNKIKENTFKRYNNGC